MNDQDPNNSDASFFGDHKDKDSAKQEEEEVVTKSNAHKAKRKGIHKRKEKTTKSTKRSFNGKEKEKEAKLFIFAERQASAIIDEMEKRYEKDLELYQRKQLACRKLTYLEDLAKQLKNVYISEKFLEQNGLGVFEKWLTKVSVGEQGESVEPSIALRKAIFEILLSLNVRSDHIVRAQELQRIIQRNKRSQTKELRDLSEQIISKWSQMTYEDAEG